MTTRYVWLTAAWVFVGALLFPLSAARAQNDWEVRGSITATNAFELSSFASVSDTTVLTRTSHIGMFPATPSGVQATSFVVDPENVASVVFNDIPLTGTSNFSISHFNWHHAGNNDYLAAVVNNLHLVALSSADGLIYTTNPVTDTGNYFSSEAARSTDTDWIGGYNVAATDYHIFRSPLDAQTYVLADTIGGNVVDSIFGWPRTGFAVNPSNKYCVAYWLIQSATLADGYYECPPSAPQQFADDLPVSADGFPEAISRFIADGQGSEYFLYAYNSGSAVRAMWTDGSATFQTAVLGSAPVLDAVNSYYGIGMAHAISSTLTAEVAWPTRAVRLDLTTAVTDTLGNYPFGRIGANGLFIYDRNGQAPAAPTPVPALAALGTGSVLLATLTGRAAPAPTLGWFALVTVALVLCGLGSITITRQRSAR